MYLNVGCIFLNQCLFLFFTRAAKHYDRPRGGGVLWNDMLTVVTQNCSACNAPVVSIPLKRLIHCFLQHYLANHCRRMSMMSHQNLCHSLSEKK